jgi:CrcB protein
MAPDTGPPVQLAEASMPLLLVAVGGAAGAVSRYLVDGFVLARTGAQFPWGTLVVNLTGSFVLGLLFALAIEADLLGREVRGPVMIGFIGAYTTFSTLMLETWRLWEDGAVALAAVNVVGSALLGLLAVFAGLTLGRAIG